MSRRSRLVGRPAPRSRCANTVRSSRGGGAGVRSSKAAAARAALTRLTSNCRTTSVRAPCGVTTRTSTPGRTSCEGLAVSPPTFTWPALHSDVAADRDFVTRTAHSQASMRTASAMPGPPPVPALVSARGTHGLALLAHALHELAPRSVHGPLGKSRRAGGRRSGHLDEPHEAIRSARLGFGIPGARRDERLPGVGLLRFDAPAAPDARDAAGARHLDSHLSRLCHR